MRAFFLLGYQGGAYHSVTGEEFHYLCHVRRMKEGDSLEGRDEAGFLYHCTLDQVTKKGCRLRVQRKGGPVEGGPAITLIQALPKGRKMDDIVRHMVETGVAVIQPVYTRFSVPREGNRDERLVRWNRIAREAAQQSGAASLPRIQAPTALQEAVEQWVRASGPDRLGLFFHQAPLAQGTLHEYLSIDHTHLGIVIGPEGGLAEEELRLLEQNHFVPVYLGPQVLRTETAPVFAVAAVQLLLLERQAWKLAHVSS